MAVAYGIESSETLVLTEHAIPLAPLAGESENRSIAPSFSSALCSGDKRKGNADAKAWCASALEQLVDLFGNSRQRERTQMEVSTCQCQRVGTLPVSWHCQKTHLERGPLGRKQVRTTTRNDVRCRACSFSAGGWTFSFRASPLRPSDLPRPNWIVSRQVRRAQ